MIQNSSLLDYLQLSSQFAGAVLSDSTERNYGYTMVACSYVFFENCFHLFLEKLHSQNPLSVSQWDLICGV